MQPHKDQVKAWAQTCSDGVGVVEEDGDGGAWGPGPVLGPHQGDAAPHLHTWGHHRDNLG
jgi:hypothetical protein